MKLKSYRGPWVDNSNEALDAALADVRVARGEYVVCEYSNDGYRLEPVDPDRLAIGAEVVYSEARQQYRAVIWQEPSRG